MSEKILKIWRGDKNGGEFIEYRIEVDEGMVVLDVLHKLQATQVKDLSVSQGCRDLSVRWNCKAGKCGSCSMEINGKPRLACMTRMNEFDPDKAITLQPLKSFPIIKDLVTDLSWNYEQNNKILPFKIAKPDKDGKHRMHQYDAERIQEFRKCIECFLCQDVCHILRDHEKKDKFVGPRFMHKLANLEMHPLDTEDRIADIKNKCGSGMCNITKCCVEVCPEKINITDNAIIPLKERVVDRYYDPVMWLIRKFNIKKGAKND
jgi:succinate dehydrogenase / fumarate reductase, iron-sulfur subunit